MKRAEIEIEINADYKLVVDHANWMPIRKGVGEREGAKNFGEPTEYVVSYNHDMGLALRSIMDDMVKRDTVPEYIKHIDQMIEWYFTEQKAILDTILSRKEELLEVLKTNKVM